MRLKAFSLFPVTELFPRAYVKRLKGIIRQDCFDLIEVRISKILLRNEECGQHNMTVVPATLQQHSSGRGIAPIYLFNFCSWRF